MLVWKHSNLNEPSPKAKTIKSVNNYLGGDFQRYKESSIRNLDELVDQGVFSENEIDQMKRNQFD